jgi:hypothetical protein
VEGRLRKRVAVLSLGTETDVWNAARITAAWSARRNVESVEVIGWDITHDACALLPGVSQVHDLPLAGLRTRMQRHPLAAAIALRGAIDGIIGGRWFDAVLNLTYGGLSGHLAPLLALDPHAVVGPFVDETGQWRASHPAFEYLATWGIDPTLNVFALQDVWSAGAHVRADEGGHFVADPVADTLVDHSCGDRPTPVIVAPTTDAERWLGFGWEGLVSTLAHAGRRPVMLVAPRGEEALVERIADRTGADVARWPLRHTAALVRRCGSVLTSDFATSVFAARTGVRQVLLRERGTPPLASLPGAHILTMSGASRPLHLDAVLTFSLWHLMQRQTSEPTLQTSGAGLCIHEIGSDTSGCLTATPFGVQDDIESATLSAWRRIWRDGWVGLPPRKEDVQFVLEHGDATRIARARLDRGRVGEALRSTPRKREVAA